MRSSVVKMKSRKNASAAPSARATKIFPIVGIGASAGGLEAFSDLLHKLPEKTGMAYVLVQHLDPKHSSELREILARTTRISVTEVTDGTAVKPDHIYVIPPDTTMTIEDGALRLAARSLTRGQHLPIDNFLAHWRKIGATGLSGSSCRVRLQMAPREPGRSKPLGALPLPRMKSQQNIRVCRTARS
jgi:chemotaxis response regulator CheB